MQNTKKIPKIPDKKKKKKKKGLLVLPAVFAP